MKNRLLIVAGLLLVSATPVLAQHGRGGGAGEIGSIPDMSHVGGNSLSHMSAEGRENTNGRNAVDRDRGADRASDRRSSEGSVHNNQGHTKHKHHKHSH